MAKLLLVRQSEWPRLSYFFLLFFVISAGLAIGRGTADALFLKRFGIQYLPIMYVAIGVLMMLVSTVYAAYADRMSPERVFFIMLGGLAVMLCGNWYLMTLKVDSVAYPLYFLAFEISSEVLFMHATLYFSANFDGQQSKRLLPMTFAGLQLGEMCGGFLLTASPVIGVQGMVLVWSGLMAAAMVIVVVRHRSVGVSPFFRPGRRGGGMRRTVEQITQGLRFAQRSPLLLYSSLGVFFMVVALYSLGYAAYAVYNAEFKSETELGVLFGVLTIVSSSVTLLIQVFFSGKLLNRFGVRTMNIIFPVTTFACFIALFISFKLPAAVLSTLNRRILMPSIRTPSRTLLFEALPDYMQGRARALTLALVLPCAYIFVGLVLRELRSFHAPYSYLITGAVAGALYLYFSVKTNRAYVEALLATLKERLFLPSELLGQLNNEVDPELFGRLAEGVRHRDERICLTYARMLACHFPDKAPEVIFERMLDTSTPVRDQLIRLIGGNLPDALLQRLEPGREWGDEHVWATAIATRFEARDPHALALVDECLAAKNPRLVACGIYGVMRYGLDDRRDAALKRWEEMLADERREHVLPALGLGQKLPLPEAFVPRLIVLLGQSGDVVKTAALLALQRSTLPDTQLLPVLEELMKNSRDPKVRVACIECFRLLPEPARSQPCLAALTDRHPDVVDAALRVLAESVGDCEPLLFAWLNQVGVSPREQQRVLESLARHPVARVPFEEFAERKLREANLMSQALRVLERDPGPDTHASKLVRIVLAERLTQTLEVALMAMENLGDSHSIRIISLGLKSKDARQVARAKEALSSIADSRLGAQLGQLLAGEENAAEADAPHFASVNDALEWCRMHADAWLRLCAVRALQLTPGEGLGDGGFL
jgi:HEAT repeat protein